MKTIFTYCYKLYSIIRVAKQSDKMGNGNRSNAEALHRTVCELLNRKSKNVNWKIFHEKRTARVVSGSYHVHYLP